MERAAKATTEGRGRSRLAILALLVCAELLAIVLAYQVFASIECRLTEIEGACRGLRSMAARGLAALTVTGLFFWLRPLSFSRLSARAAAAPGHGGWLALHLVGVALIFLPLILFGPGGLNQRFAPALAMMSAGSALAAAGGLLWVVRASGWTGWLRGDRFHLPMALLFAALAPEIANILLPLWEWSSLTRLTFGLVLGVLMAAGGEVFVDESRHMIGTDGFVVQVGDTCSGVEGIALITIFMALYALLLRGDIRPGRYWLVLYPLALLTSWVFNVARISGLVLIGAHVSPEHALNGFHSYAGWLMFTLLALAVLLVAHRVGWFHRAPRTAAAHPPLSHEDVAARIAPFVVMMLSGVIASAFWPDPAAGWPLRVLMMGAALVYFLPALRRLDLAVTPLDLAAGADIGAFWIATAADLPPGDAVAGFGAIWIGFRLLGTIFLVPVIEELFFRGYVLTRLDRGSWGWRIAALAVSSLLFGLLHERLLAGAVSGVVLGLLMLRSGRVAGPIAAHILANAIIALWAMMTSNWQLI